jgi:ribosomal-protein-alanine N-acetyltransferase
MQIRPYVPADRAACLAIFEGNMPRYFALGEWSDFARWLDAQDAGQLAYPENLAEPYFVVEDNRQVIACGGFCAHRRQLVVGLAWGMVRHDLHRQGIGRTLLEHRLQLAHTHYPAYAVVLDTSQHSYPFFERLGFRVMRIIPDGYGPGLDRYDMLRPAQRQ